MNYDLLYYALTALVTAASAYGSLRSRLASLEKQMKEIQDDIQSIRLSLVSRRK